MPDTTRTVAEGTRITIPATPRLAVLVMVTALVACGERASQNGERDATLSTTVDTVASRPCPQRRARTPVGADPRRVDRAGGRLA